MAAIRNKLVSMGSKQYPYTEIKYEWQDGKNAWGLFNKGHSENIEGFFFLIQWTHRNYYVPGTKCLTIANSFHPHNNFESEIAQLCQTLCNPMDCSPPASSVHGILQARILEWVAISFSRGSSRPRDRIQVSHIAFTLWTTREAHNSFMRSLLFTIYIRGNWGTEVR